MGCLYVVRIVVWYVIAQDSLFDGIGGNGILLSGSVSNTTVARNMNKGTNSTQYKFTHKSIYASTFASVGIIQMRAPFDRTYNTNCNCHLR